jgi:23S rRNA pseudouridine1911/1915/1917 synthase
MRLKTENFIGERLDKSLSIESCVVRSTIQVLIKNGKIKKNGDIFTDNSYKIKKNDLIEYEILQENFHLKPKKMDLKIIYEDNDVIVIDKPINLIVHPNGNNDEDTLVNVLIDKYKELSNIGGHFRLGIVHRLDKNTSGLMLIAKNNDAHLNLKYQLENRILSRNYMGIVWNVLHPREGKIDGYIKRDKLKMTMVDENTNNARYSCTNYKTIATYLNNSISLVEFKLDTGRTHQIRIHCSHKKCPIVGDKTYGGNSLHLKKEFSIYKDVIEKFERQALHSYKISFIQPTTKEKLQFNIPISEDMQNLINEIEKY